MIVVADTSPLNYLIQIESDFVLPRLYRKVLIPSGFLDELRSPSAPPAVKAWIALLLGWIEVRGVGPLADHRLDYLGIGEREALFESTRT
jgi:predicted nucleic acid-binding protein